MEKISNLFGMAAMSFILEIICLDSLDGTVKYAAAIALAVSFAFFVWKGVSAFEEGKVRTDDKAEEALKLQSDTLVAAINKLCNQQHENNQSVLASMQRLSEERLAELRKLFSDMHDAIEAGSQKNVAELSGVIADYQVAREKMSLEMFNKFEDSNKKLLSGTVTKIESLCDKLVEKNQELAADIMQNLANLEQQSLHNNSTRIESFVQDVAGKLDGFVHDILLHNGKIIAEMDSNIVASVKRIAEINERTAAGVKDMHNSLVNNNNALTDQLHSTYEEISEFVADVIEERSKNIDDLLKALKDNNDNFKDDMATLSKNLKRKIDELPNMLKDSSDDILEKFDEGIKKMCANQKDFVLEIKQYNDEMKKMSEDDLEILRELLRDGK